MPNLPVSFSRPRPNRRLWPPILPVMSSRVKTKVNLISLKNYSLLFACARKSEVFIIQKSAMFVVTSNARAPNSLPKLLLVAKVDDFMEISLSVRYFFLRVCAAKIALNLF